MPQPPVDKMGIQLPDYTGYLRPLRLAGQLRMPLSWELEPKPVPEPTIMSPCICR